MDNQVQDQVTALMDAREARRIMLALLNKTNRVEPKKIHILWCPCGAIADCRDNDGHGWDGWIVVPLLECLCAACVEKSVSENAVTLVVPECVREEYRKKVKQVRR